MGQCKLSVILPLVALFNVRVVQGFSLTTIGEANPLISRKTVETFAKKKKNKKPKKPVRATVTKRKSVDTDVKIQAPTSNTEGPAKPPLQLLSSSVEPSAVMARFNHITEALDRNTESICDQLEDRGFFLIDGLFGESACAAMRAEAQNLHALGHMTSSQSTRWDPSARGGVGAVVPYDKHNVLSVQIEGGEEQYGIAPRLVEYTVGLTESLAPAIATRFPDSAPLDETAQTNKLAVCLGDGSLYDKHIDNLGGDDLRKLTVLYYLNRKDWDMSTCGGSFRALRDLVKGSEIPVPSTEIPELDDSSFSFVDIEPRGDRLFGFWSDKLVHRVLPSYAPNGFQDYRYALTIWLLVRDPKFIGRDPEVERLHFGHLAEEAATGQG